MMALSSHHQTGYRNSVYSAICKLSKKDESDVFNWISACNNVDSVAELPPGRFPVLDRTVGHKLLESARHTRFSLDFQTMQEAYQRKGKHQEDTFCGTFFKSSNWTKTAVLHCLNITF